MIAGRDILLKVREGGTDRTVAGLRTKSLSLDARPVDVTDAGSGGWREILPGAGLRSAELTGQGIFRSAASDATLRAAFFDQSALACTFLMPGFGELSGDFLVTRLAYAGRHDGEAAFEMTFASVGAIAFADLPGVSP